MRRRFDFGETFSRVFSVLFGGFTTWVGVSLIFFIPLLLVSFLLFKSGVRFDLVFASTADEDPFSLMRPSFYIAVLAQIHSQLTAAGLVHGIFKLLRGEETSVQECIDCALSRFWAVLSLSVLWSLAVFAGSMLCCVPGILIAVFWYVAMPALIVERVGVGEAISRSQYLTLGYRRPVFFIGFLLYVIFFAISLTVGLFQFVGPAPYLAIYLINMLLTPLLGSVGTGVVYHDLREAKEGLRDQDLEEVFS